METTLYTIRNEYTGDVLLENQMNPNPFLQFKEWIELALNKGVSEPTAFTLITTGTNLRPSGRIVLLKDFDSEGFVFFTNYGSRKGMQLSENPFASMLFFWPDLFRQIRIEGEVMKIGEPESEAYFSSRPEESQISAIISPQSQVIPTRNYLENLWNEYLQIHPGNDHKRPENWGGYKIIPNYFEFWQGRVNRLHDRIVYERCTNGWNTNRLAP